MRWSKCGVLATFLILASPPAASYAGIVQPLPSRQQSELEAPSAEFGSRIVRGLEEPLVATGRASADETEALDAAVSAYLLVAPSGDLSPLQHYVDQYPDSAWRVSMLVNLGHEGYFTRAIEAWRSAWVAAQEIEEPLVKALVDRALGELARMHARVGRSEELSALPDDIGDRPISGPASEMITGAREALCMFANEPGISFLCRPMALKNLLITLGVNTDTVALMNSLRSGPRGFNLEELALYHAMGDLLEPKLTQRYF